MPPIDQDSVYDFIESIRNALPKDLTTLQQIEGMALAARSLAALVSTELDEPPMEIVCRACDHFLDGYTTPIHLASPPSPPAVMMPILDAEAFIDRRDRYAISLTDLAYLHHLDWLVAAQALGIAAKFVVTSTIQQQPLVPNAVLALNAIAAGFSFPVSVVPIPDAQTVH